MKILEVLLILIATSLLLIAAEKRTATNASCETRCNQLINSYGGHNQFGTNQPDQSANLIYENDIPFLFIPANFNYNQGQ